MKTATILFCLLVLFAFLSVSDAARLKTNVRRANTAAQTTQDWKCFYYWDCYWTDVPGIGEEEVCDLVQKCEFN